VRIVVVSVSMVLGGAALAQVETESVEMVGTVGSRSALLVLHAAKRTDGGWNMAGEYVLLPTLSRRFVEGERGPELGVTTLREGTSAIFFGRSPTGELRGTYRDGVFKGMRYGPGGQERERFEFSEEFPSMDGYSAKLSCDAGGGRYESSLQFSVASGKLQSGALEWRSTVAPLGHHCSVKAAEQQPLEGGLRFASGACTVTLRDLGEQVKVAAQNCAAHCGSGAYLEPMLVDRRGRCRLLAPEPR
jgi:hypothetical protein